MGEPLGGNLPKRPRASHAHRPETRLLSKLIRAPALVSGIKDPDQGSFMSPRPSFRYTPGAAPWRSANNVACILQAFICRVSNLV